jgi:hypothetical protein
MMNEPKQQGSTADVNQIFGCSHRLFVVGCLSECSTEPNKMAALFGESNVHVQTCFKPLIHFIQIRSNSDLSGSCNMSAILEHLIGQTLTDNNWPLVIYLRDIPNK